MHASLRSTATDMAEDAADVYQEAFLRDLEQRRGGCTELSAP